MKFTDFVIAAPRTKQREKEKERTFFFFLYDFFENLREKDFDDLLSSVQQCCVTDYGAFVQYFMVILVFNVINVINVCLTGFKYTSY